MSAPHVFAVLTVLAWPPLVVRLLNALLVNRPLVVVGIGGIWVAIRALKATQKTADAALLNAQAFINSERPWFVVTLEQFEGRLPIYSLTISNRGRTPGILREMFAEYAFVVRPENLPSPPVYQSPCIAPDDTFFASDDSRRIRPPYSPTDMLQKRTSDPNHSPGELLVLYGYLSYDDALDETRPTGLIHEMRWCFYWFTAERRWVECGPDDYRGPEMFPKTKFGHSRTTIDFGGSVVHNVDSIKTSGNAGHQPSPRNADRGGQTMRSSKRRKTRWTHFSKITDRFGSSGR